VRIPFTYADAGVKGIAVADPPAVRINVSGHFLARPGQEYDKLDKDIHFSNTVTQIRGSHELKFGGEVIRSYNDIRNKYRTMGIFNFNGFASGHAMADFMLGRVRSFQQGGGEYKDLVGNRWGLFVQDNYRLRPNLTLDLGLRWDPAISFHDELGRVQCFRPGLQSTRFPNAPSGYLSAGDAGCPDGGYDGYWGALGPRFGFAWRASGTPWVVRGGIGLFWNQQFTHLYNRFVNAAPLSPQVDRYDVKFEDPYEGTFNPFPEAFAPYNPPANVAFHPPLGLFGSFAADYRPSYMQTCNLTVNFESGVPRRMTVAIVNYRCDAVFRTFTFNTKPRMTIAYAGRWDAP